MKRNILISIVSLIVGVVIFPSIGLAQATTTSTTTTAQINSISALLQQIQTLQNQINALQASQKTLKLEVATQFNAFVTDLSLGSRGDAVTALQALLAANPDIYPEGLITGFFGKATERALKRLQKENSLEQIGRVGPRTRALLNKLLRDNPLSFENGDRGDDHNNATSTNNKNDEGKEKRLCANIPPGHLIAPGWLEKHDGIRPTVPECQKVPEGIEHKIDNGDDGNKNDNKNDDRNDNRNDNKDDDREHGTTTLDVIPPVVINLLATSTASTTATITWSTNEQATSKLWYSTSSPFIQSSAVKVENNSLKTSHAYDLSGLIGGTTYYYELKVSDKFQNSVTIPLQSFQTLSN